MAYIYSVKLVSILLYLNKKKLNALRSTNFIQLRSTPYISNVTSVCFALNLHVYHFMDRTLESLILSLSNLLIYCDTMVALNFLLQYFGQSFIHDGSSKPVTPPPYIDPYDLLEDDRISRPPVDVY
jgi:hypothetical protein